MRKILNDVKLIDKSIERWHVMNFFYYYFAQILYIFFVVAFKNEYQRWRKKELLLNERKQMSIFG